MDPSEIPLRDLHLPESVGWWPMAPGWWIVIALLLVALSYLAVRVWRNWKFKAPRRYAISALAKVEADYLHHKNVVLLGQQLSELLRRAMLAYAPRHEIAGLTGEDWLLWLDRDLPVPYFHTEGGKSLLQLPYRNPDADVGSVDINALLSAVRMRLATPLGRPR